MIPHGCGFLSVNIQTSFGGAGGTLTFFKQDFGGTPPGTPSLRVPIAAPVPIPSGLNVVTTLPIDGISPSVEQADIETFEYHIEVISANPGGDALEAANVQFCWKDIWPE